MISGIRPVNHHPVANGIGDREMGGADVLREFPLQVAADDEGRTEGVVELLPAVARPHFREMPIDFRGIRLEDQPGCHPRS